MELTITPEMKSLIIEAATEAAKAARPEPAPEPDAADLDARIQSGVKSYMDKFTTGLGVMSGPAEIKSGLGDSETKALAAYIRTGQRNSAVKASNDTDMNIGTAADGGYDVPTGHYQGIIARRNEYDITTKLGLRPIPGKGTTVQVATDAADVSGFVATAEAAAFDRDAPVQGQASMTLVKYTKKIELSYELLRDEDSRLMEFLNDWVGRNMAVTRNSLLLTEVATNGGSLKTLAATAAIAAGELEDVAWSNGVAYYLGDSANVAWVTRPATYGAITKLSGNYRWYGETGQGDIAQTGPNILGYPVLFSQAVAAPAASAKSLVFGNFNFVGYREGSGFSFLRDPYSKAGNGQVVLYYMFDVVYKVLNSQAIGYAVQAAA